MSRVANLTHSKKMISEDIPSELDTANAALSENEELYDPSNVNSHKKSMKSSGNATKKVIYVIKYLPS